MKFSLKVALIVFALAALLVGSVLAKKYRKGRSDDAWLGVITTDLSSKMIKKLELDHGDGALILDVSDDSPAEEAGLEKKDVVIAIGDEKVYDADDLGDLIDDHEVGDEIKLLIIRDGEEQTITATLDEGQNYFGSGYRHAYRTPNVHRVYKGNWHRDDNGYIGIKLDNLSRQLGEFFGIERGRGALVTEVVEDSPAATAGLKAGDVITAIDGHSVRESDDVVEDVHDAEIGETLKFTIMRDRSEMTIEVEVGEPDEDWFGYDTDVEWHGLDGLAGLKGLAGLQGLEGLQALEGLHVLEDLADIRIIDAPSSPGVYFHSDDDFDFDFDFDFDMDELEADMRDLEDELRDMEIDLKTDLKDLRLQYD